MDVSSHKPLLVLTGIVFVSADRILTTFSRFIAFDIVIGGPPCVDYTSVNARRGGVDGIQGSYLPKMGDVIARIKYFNKTNHCNLFFLAENAALWNDKEKPLEAGDLQTVLRSFGMEWHVTLDSRDHTPLRRKRTYITNIPMVEDLKMIDPPPSLCFDDGYDVAGMIFDPESGLSKAAGLMANKLRLDDHPRMSIYKEYGKRHLKFFRRTPTVTERERLMGLPPNYVSKPRECLVVCVVFSLSTSIIHGLTNKCIAVKRLFSSLVYRGFAPETVEFNQHWEDCLPQELHEFAGDHHNFKGRWSPFEFYSAPTSETDPTPAVKLKLAPPLATMTVSRKGKNLEFASMVQISHSFSTLSATILHRRRVWKTINRQCFLYPDCGISLAAHQAILCQARICGF